MQRYQIRCQTCGYSLIYPEGALKMACPACHCTNCRLKAPEEAQSAFAWANELLEGGDFEKAEQAYERLLTEYPDEHPAIWSLLLSRYHIVYEFDRDADRWQPTVGLLQEGMMQEDPRFLRAVRLAEEDDAQVAERYRRDAECIDDVMMQIRELQRKRKPFDVFICHKTTTPDGGFTKDYDRGLRLYDELKARGYRVFFAPREMARVSGGASYEAGIYHALSTAKIMLLVCSRSEYLDSTWVRSEWKRYLGLFSQSEPRCLLPLCYENMPAEALPAPLRRRKLEAVEMGDTDSMALVLEKVREYAGEPVPEIPCAPEDDFTVTRGRSGCTVTGYTGAALRVRIPSVIFGQRVTAIGDGAFFGHGEMTDVALPDEVTAIGAQAFGGCTSLQSVSLPQGLRSIGEEAFLGCAALEEITLPRGLTGVGSRAFQGCLRLTAAALPETLQELGNGAFFGCSALTAVTLPASVRELEGRVFMCCTALGQVSLPKGLRSIGANAFRSCRNLRTLTIPDSVEEIGPEAFAGCPMLTLKAGRSSAAKRYARDAGLPCE